jgi:hypothetical protein
MGWVVNATSRPPPIYPQERDPVTIVQDAGWAKGRSGQVRKTSFPQEFDPQAAEPTAGLYTDWAIPAHVWYD